MDPFLLRAQKANGRYPYLAIFACLFFFTANSGLVVTDKSIIIN